MHSVNMQANVLNELFCYEAPSATSMHLYGPYGKMVKSLDPSISQK